MIWETGNELSEPDVRWTTAISDTIKALAPFQLVGSGRYGVDLQDLNIQNLDLVSVILMSQVSFFFSLNLFLFDKEICMLKMNKIEGKKDRKIYISKKMKSKVITDLNFMISTTLSIYSFNFQKSLMNVFFLKTSKNQSNRSFNSSSTDHFYPPSIQRLQSASNLASQHSKAYFIGEYDWTDRSTTYLPLLTILIPSLLLLMLSISLYMPTFSQHFPLRCSLPRPILIKRWYLILCFTLVEMGIVFGLGAWVLHQQVTLHTFLNSIETSTTASGALYWSLLGRDDSCCGWVEHVSPSHLSIQTLLLSFFLFFFHLHSKLGCFFFFFNHY